MLTLKKRREQQKALETAAAAPRKSYLGRFTPLNGIQSAWIKSLLTVWGESMRGGTAPRRPTGHACWRFQKGMQWSDAALERFTVAITQAREEGFRGQQALNRAHAILWPSPASSVIDTAIQNDDADFVEQCVLQAFESNDPVYVIGNNYYTTRKKSPISLATCSRSRHGSHRMRQESACAGAWKFSGQKFICRLASY